MRHLFTTLRFRLILLVFLAVLPALGVILYSGLEQRRLAAEAAKKHVINLVHHASLHEERVVEGVRQMLFTLAELCSAVRNLQVKYQDQLLQSTTISLGAAIFPDHGLTAEEVIAAADGALYRAKQAGRDRVEIARCNSPAAAVS